MYTYIAGCLAYLAFELTALHACASGTRILCRSAQVRGPYEVVLVTLLGYITLPAACAHAITGLRLNSPVVWLGLVLTYWAALYAHHARNIRAGDEFYLLRPRFMPGSRTHADTTPLIPTDWLYISFFVSAGVVALNTARLLDEIDSLGSIQDIIKWASNTQSANKSFFNYVTLWEMRYVPMYIMIGECSSSWTLALAPLLGLYVCCAFLTHLLNFPPIPAMLYAVCSLFLMSFWTPGPTGLFTLKNDLAYNFAIFAGTIAILRILGDGWTVLRVWWIAFAIGLACIKYSGILIAAAWVAVLATGTATFALTLPRPVICLLGPLVVIPMIMSGHHYVRNLVVHGNPFFPISVTFFGAVLPGTAKLEGTAILDGITQAETWRLLFMPSGWTHPLGPWFGPVVVALLWWSPILLGRITAVAITRSRKDLEFVLTGCLTLVYWYVYVKSFWSASAVPGDNAYLTNLGSMRYATAALFITEAFALHVVWRVTSSRVMLTLCTGGALAYRIWLLIANRPHSTLPVFDEVVHYILPVVALTAIAVWSLIHYGRFALPIAVMAYGAACLVITEKSVHVRCGWAELWSPIVDACFEGPPKHVSQVVGGVAGSQIFFDPLAAFYARGRRHQNDLHLVASQDLEAHLLGRSGLDHVVCFASRDVIPDAVRGSLLSHGVPADHASVARNARAEAIGWLPSVSASDLGDHTGSPIPVVVDSHMPAPGRESTVGPQGKRAALWRENQLFAFGSPLEVYIIRGSFIRRLQFGSGDELSLADYGDQAPPAPAAVKIRWDGQQWQLSIPREVVLDDDQSLLQTATVTAPEPMGFKAIYDPVTGHATLDVTRPMPWVIWGFTLPSSAAGHTITVRARLHTNAGPRCNMHWFDYDQGEVRHFVQTDATESVEPQLLSLVVDPIGSPERDYIGVGVARAIEGDTVRLDFIEFLRGAWDIPGIETHRD